MVDSSRNERGERAEKKQREALGARHDIAPAARRALQEAAERRRSESSAPSLEEVGGRGGLDPVRYGDWESKGLASDF
jgi:hypothetical protein